MRLGSLSKTALFLCNKVEYKSLRVLFAEKLFSNSAFLLYLVSELKSISLDLNPKRRINPVSWSKYLEVEINA